MKLLFICTHNRCRSIIAEAVCNHIGKGQLSAKSAGSQPAGEVHPLSLKYLAKAGIPTAGLQSQSWDDHEAWQPDVVITVCDSAAGESCPVWFGKTTKVHWGLVDPSSMTGTEADIESAFMSTIETLTNRIGALIQNDIQGKSAEDLRDIFTSLESL